MEAVGYCRVSTQGQADDGVSLEAQQERIAAWCLAQGHTLIGFHTDAGLSGKRADNRPGLQAALDVACNPGRVLVVYSLSRLARSTKDMLAIAEDLDLAGGDLASLSESIDTTSAAGKMVFRMLAVLAEFEADLVSERTRSAMAHKKAAGERVGTLPFGFTVGADGKTLVPDQEEQEVIALIHDLRRDGLSLRGIRDELHKRGVRNRAGSTWWRPNTIGDLVRSA